MKKTVDLIRFKNLKFLFYTFYLLLISTFYGCQNDLILSNSKELKSYGIFQGEKVLLADNLTQKELDQTPSDFLTNLLKNSSARVNGENDLGITYNELISYFKTKFEGYPELDMNILEIKRFDVLQQDFPNIKSKESAFEISGKILDFYELKLRNDLKKDLKLLQQKSGKGRKMSLEPNAMEINYVAQHPIAGLGMKNGASLGDSWTLEKFPNANID